MKKELLENFFDIIHFSNLFGKTTSIPIVNIHNSSNSNIYLEMRNKNVENDFMYIICDKQKIIGYNSKLNKYKCSSKFPQEFYSKIEEATMIYTNKVIESFYSDIYRFRILNINIYNSYEIKIINKFINKKILFSDCGNVYNKWRDESIPLIEYKPSHPIIDADIY